MILATELRIGNWFINMRDKEEGKNYNERVASIQTDYVNYSVSLEEIDPIELHEDIIEKCGFIHVADLDGFQKEVRAGEILKLEKLPGDHGWSFRVREIVFRQVRYLHDFQNLFWSITGEELGVKGMKIKLTKLDSDNVLEILHRHGFKELLLPSEVYTKNRGVKKYMKVVDGMRILEITIHRSDVPKARFYKVCICEGKWVGPTQFNTADTLEEFEHVILDNLNYKLPEYLLPPGEEY